VTCVVVVVVAATEALRQFANQEEGKRQPLEAYNQLPSNGSVDVTLGTSE
jgi:hypothetical protein